jgi:hypothetical protein
MIKLCNFYSRIVTLAIQSLSDLLCTIGEYPAKEEIETKFTKILIKPLQLNSSGEQATSLHSVRAAFP